MAKNRTQALCKAFGWQGGTIHQIAEKTGCSVDELLYGNPTTEKLGSSYYKGWFAGLTCPLNFRQEKGNLDFWLGVAQGIIQKESIS